MDHVVVVAVEAVEQLLRSCRGDGQPGPFQPGTSGGSSTSQARQEPQKAADEGQRADARGVDVDVSGRMLMLA